MIGKSLKAEYGIDLREMLQMLDWRGRLTMFGGLVRVFTLAQAARFVWNGDLAAAEAGLDQLEWQDNWIAALDGVPLPKGMGGGHAKVYHVTDKGGKWLMDSCRELGHRLRFGAMNRKMRARIPHELLVTEGFLTVWESDTVTDFLPDEELRHRIRAEQERRRKRTLPRLASEATGDFVLVLATGDPARPEEWVQYEAAIRYRDHQIAGKPARMRWITCTDTQADTVEKVTGVRSIRIGDVRKLPADRAEQAPMIEQAGPGGIGGTQAKSGGRPLDKRVLKAIETLGGAATAEAVAAVLGAYRTHVVQALRRMEGGGLLYTVEGQLDPGVGAGRPQKLYVRFGHRLDGRMEKLIALTRSEVIMIFSPRGYRLEPSATTPDELKLEHVEGAKVAVVVVLDDPREPEQSALAHVKRVEARQLGAATKVFIAVAVPGRASSFQAIDPQSLPINVVRERARRRMPPPSESSQGQQNGTEAAAAR